MTGDQKKDLWCFCFICMIRSKLHRSMPQRNQREQWSSVMAVDSIHCSLSQHLPATAASRVQGCCSDGQVKKHEDMFTHIKLPQSWNHFEMYWVFCCYLCRICLLHSRHRLLEALRVASVWRRANKTDHATPVLPYARLAFIRTLNFLNKVACKAAHKHIHTYTHHIISILA